MTVAEPLADAAGNWPLVAIMGPTAAGKTELALQLAERLPVDIVTVDSAQVYRGLDIGTAKPSLTTRARVPHHLIDLRDPAEPYSAADFRRDARSALERIRAAGRLPLLVGGTMLYFRALEHGLAEMPPADPAVRAELALEAEREGWPALHARLARIDPEAAAGIHPNDPQRIQRALEVHRLSGRPISWWWRQQASAGQAAGTGPAGFRLMRFALLPASRAWLRTRIEARFDAMLDAGLVEEVRCLRARGDLGSGLPALRAVGYRQVWSHLEGETDFATTRARAIIATRRLAKRQLTWLRRWPGLRTHAAPLQRRAGDDVLKTLEALSMIG